jgi:hypothetical protein
MAPGSYVFLASRPASAKYLPQDEKQRAIRLVHEQTLKMGLTLVVRLHPFESGKRQFQRWLGKAGGTNRWLETQRHPLDIGADCALAATLNSSVAIDMAAMGVPVVEPIDYSVFPDDSQHTRLDRHGCPIGVYSQLGITVPANNAEDLASALNRLRRANIVGADGPSAEYRALYADPAGSIDGALRHILRACQS